MRWYKVLKGNNRARRVKLGGRLESRTEDSMGRAQQY